MNLNSHLYSFSPLLSRYVDDHRLCCHFQNLESCTTLEPQPPLFNCGSLMQNTTLRVSMWILGLSALIGNLFAVIWRLKENPRSHTRAVQSFLVGNLAMSDFLMGVYMLILACVDAYYGDEYFLHSDEWRAGGLCRFIGFISLMSSEASVFFLTLISVDRVMSVVFPFSHARLTPYTAKVLGAFLWLLTFVVSLTPVLLAGPDSDFYDLSDVCIGLPLITRPASFNLESSGIGNEVSFSLPVAKDSKPAWYFSIALFLGVNLFCFVCIFACYVAVFVSLKRSGNRVKRRRSKEEEMRVAIKMAIIVGTDFLCWMPVIIMGLLSQTGLAVIPLEAYTWSVVFILPINSSLNPYLYTIVTILGKRGKVAPGDDDGSSVDRSKLNTQVTNTNVQSTC